MTPDEQFAVVFRRHYSDVERYLWRRVPDLPVADLTAEVMLTAWRRWADVPKARPLPWLYGVARNVAANAVRQRGRGRRLAERLAAYREPVVAADHADGIAEQALVAAAFDRLGEADREILRLVEWEQLSLADVGRVLGCSVPAATMRLSRARGRLRAALTADAPRAHRPAAPTPVPAPAGEGAIL
jgi:RNA polymerase sigma factor (sigma-70 family)